MIKSCMPYILILTIGWGLHFPLKASMHQINYHRPNYSDNHWAIKSMPDSDPLFISEFKIDEFKFLFYLNPTDARGYRSIIRLIDSDPYASINRRYSSGERMALSIAMGIGSIAYESMGLIPQMDILGNNSHSYHLASKEIQIGQDHEPSFLHGHVYGRGDPEHTYVPGVPLRGPTPGNLLVLGASLNETWLPGELELVSKHVANQLRELFSSENSLFEKYQLDLVRIKM